MSGEIHDVIKHVNFGEDRSEAFGVARNRVLAFSIDLLRRKGNHAEWLTSLNLPEVYKNNNNKTTIYKAL